MPPKKQAKDNGKRTAGLIRTRQETLVDQVVAQVSQGFDDKFQRLQEAIAAMAPAVAVRQQEDANVRRPKRRMVEQQDTSDTDEEVRNIIEQATQPPKPKADKVQKERPDESAPSTAIRQTPVRRYDAPPAAAKDGWKAWIAAQQSRPNEMDHLPLSIKDFNYDNEEDIQHILSSTAHQLARGNQRPGLFPHKYVSRGPEQRRATLNSLSLPEYNWATLRMIKDQKVPADIKPYIISHLEEVNEDACEYDWPSAVRRWSEQVYTQVAEDRLPAGWASTDRIQFLRLTTSRVSTARIVNRDQNVRQRPPAKGAPSQHEGNKQNEGYKGGPPCPQFNSPQGCSFQSGHLGPNGNKLVHVCSFCLMNLAASNLHSEAVCRNKTRKQFNNFNHF